MIKIFEKISSVTKVYPQIENTTVLHQGRRYRLIGESNGQDKSLFERLQSTLEFVGLAVVTFFTFGLVLASEEFSLAIRWRFSEIRSGKQLNLHYVQEKPAKWQEESVPMFITALQKNISVNEHILNKLNAVSWGLFTLSVNLSQSNPPFFPTSPSLFQIMILNLGFARNTDI